MVSVEYKRQPNFRARRSRLEIEAAILKALVADSLSMNKLVVLVNLNRQLANESVRQLVANGLVEARAEAKPVVYSTTTEGLEWLRRFRSLVRGTGYLVQGKNELALRGKRGPQTVVV